MAIYVITGGTTGIGAAARQMLQAEGHEVFNIDYKGGDFLADLSTKQGRQDAIDAVFQRYPDGIDGSAMQVWALLLLRNSFSP